MTEAPSRYGVPHLNPPSVVKRAGWQDSEELRVNNWLTPWDGEEALDAGFLGLPYSGASINPSAAYGGPEALRLAFRYNTTYSPDWDTDIRGLRARDLGDVAGHLTDVAAAHAGIEAAVSGICTLEPAMPIMIGGILPPLLRRLSAASARRATGRFGVINIDAHLDVHNFEHGPTTGRRFAPS
ncbi:MAG: arginase family protein [Thermomicrobiales bacterium]